jgi:hypothetical protein
MREHVMCATRTMPATDVMHETHVLNALRVPSPHRSAAHTAGSARNAAGAPSPCTASST